MLDTGAIEDKLGTDDLNDIGADLLRDPIRRLPRVRRAGLQHAALDQFTTFERIVRLTEDRLTNAALADEKNRFEGVGHSAKLGPLFTGQHEYHPSILVKLGQKRARPFPYD